MNKTFCLAAILYALNTPAFAHKKKDEEKDTGIKQVSVPAVVKTALAKKYPGAAKVTWEKEKGDYEANWGGRSGEDNSVQFTPSGEFIEIVRAIPVSELPAPVITFIKQHYKGKKITEGGRVTDAKGTVTYEAEVNRKDIRFDKNGNFVKADN